MEGGLAARPPVGGARRDEGVTEVDEHPGGGGDGVDAGQALHHQQGHPHPLGEGEEGGEGSWPRAL